MGSIQRRRRGFTLVELLVVIAIIAMLISVLMPALAGARIEGRKVKCGANLRKIARLGHVYANGDPSGVFAPTHPYNSSGASDIEWGFVEIGYADYGGGVGASPRFGLDQEYDPRGRPLNIIQYGPEAFSEQSIVDQANFKLFQCPGEDLGWQAWPGFVAAVPEEIDRPYFDATGTSYRMNNLPYHVCTGPGFSGKRNFGISSRSLSRVPDAASTIAFMEARTHQTRDTNDEWGTLQHGELDGYHARLGYFNVAFADGHVSYADFGDGTYHPQNLEYVDVLGTYLIDARGAFGRFDCLPEGPCIP